ncbi:MAG TPA: hypothetical protein PK200_13575 [Spirochaetota bacterium]|nr:hypothetical protein [Spirochaetota bacterium]HQO03757.1 hypothetical protein [Spirochaetota bacterium]HQP47182.1 hypothetical protein [Spirochaetota bacterium]
MEINAITMINHFSTDSVMHSHDRNGTPSFTPVPGLKKSDYSFENVTMNIDDMKNILYMMLRGKNVEITEQTNKTGQILNKLA